MTRFGSIVTAGLVFVASLSSMATAFADEVRTHVSPGVASYTVPFYPDGMYRSDVKSPSDFLGFDLGSRAATYDELIGYFRYLADNSPNAHLVDYATSYEGRKLVYLVVTSQENARMLREIREGMTKLADPRTIDNEAEAGRLIGTLPATAWMGYGIHGDELSSSDAALQLAYQVLAGTDSTSTMIRDRLVVCIDPTQNPDGRARWLKQVEQWNGVVPNADTQSFHHRGTWPYGRGNHYLFDLNRDWFTQVHPESRGRTEAILSWNPQFVLDCHEMGPTDTYLFDPPREPFNPFMVSYIRKWWDIFSLDQAAAFDRYGWSYYTREWNEELYPGYGSSWGIYLGAVGILYEQAGVDASIVKRPDGTIMSYRESVHHQFTSSMANLTTLAKNRESLLRDFYDEKKRAVGRGKRKGNRGAFLFPPNENEGRMNRFATALRRQRIEIEVAQGAFELSRALSGKDGRVRDVRLPEGTLIVPLQQPVRHLIETILTFDIRLPSSFLETERKELLKNNETRLYEVTGWSLPLAYNLDAYYVEALPKLETVAYAARAESGSLVGTSALFGYAVDNTDDRSYGLLARLFEHGFRVWGAKKAFEVGGRVFGPGSYVIRLSANRGLDEDELDALARQEGVDIYAVNSALGGEHADLGGNEFALLEPPKIGIVGGESVSTYEFGSVWHLIDSRLRYASSTLEVDALSRLDLRRYNVIVLPSTSRDDVYATKLGKTGIERLRDWVRQGGTLITMGNGTAFLADTTTAMGKVRQRRQVLEDLSEYDSVLDWSKMAESPVVDSLALWEGGGAVEGVTSPTPRKPADIDSLRIADEMARRLRPNGAILAVELDADHWLGFGVRSPAAVMVRTEYAYLAPQGVEVAARFEDESGLRLSGLLWPEARKRWSETAWATREGLENGQLILFATQPNFRGHFYAGERMLLNAMLLGPGFGTSVPTDLGESR